MARCLVVLAIVARLGIAHGQDPGEPASPPAGRVIEGRVTDFQGRAVREGRVMFAPQTPPLGFSDAGTAAIDADGRYRIALARFSTGQQMLPATGQLRYLVLVAGFRSGVGVIDAGSAPATVDVQLTPEVWTTNDILLVDCGDKPVAGADLTLAMGGSVVWSRETSDVNGRCRIKSAPRQGFSVSIQRDGFLPVTFGSRAAADDPTSYTVTLYDAIHGRVVDPSGKPLAGIQIGGMISRDYDTPLKKGSNRLVMAPLRGYEKPVTTDAEGRFIVAPRIILNRRSGKFRVVPRLALCLADEALRQVYFLRFDEEHPRRSYEITLRPGAGCGFRSSTQ